MKPYAALIALAFSLAGPTVTHEAFGDWRVWTVVETRRVLRDEPPGENVAVRLAAARNEWESFQILVRSDTPVGGVNVAAGDLVGPDGAVLEAADARLFRQHQQFLQVSQVPFYLYL